MKSVMFATVLASTLVGTAMGGVLSTGTSANNGAGGIFLDLTPTSSPLVLTSFATVIGSSAGLPVTVEVWTRPGSYVGFTGSNTGWTLSQTLNGTSAGSGSVSNDFVLSNPIALPAGSTTAVYLHSITLGGGIRYFGIGTDSISNYSNADLALFTNVGRTGNVAFGGNQFSPRAFVGNLSYNIVPAPASLALVGLGGLVAGRRRR